MIPSSNDIENAQKRIAPYIHRTPILSSQSINVIAGCTIFFKCENFQNVGAFKARGAMNAALSLSERESQHGIATHSSGNHAQAIARSAKILGVKSHIVMPRTAAEIKRKGVLAYGGKVYPCESTLSSREETLKEVILKTGAVEIHPFNNYNVIAGQATAAKELFEDQKDLDIVLTPVGGGGLISGTALAAKYFSPSTLVIGAEPEGADDAYRSFQSKKIEPSQSNTIADGLLTSLGDKTLPIILEHVYNIITVDDNAIVAAMRLTWERMKIIIEPSSAVPLAALLKTKEKFAGKKVAIIISGGNVDLEKIKTLFHYDDFNDTAVRT